MKSELEPQASKTTTNPSAIRAQAEQAISLGYSALPILAEGSPQHTEFEVCQNRHLTPKELEAWFSGDERLGIATGLVSGGLEAFVYNDPEIYEDFCKHAEAEGCLAILDKVRNGYHERSPDDHHLLLYRYDQELYRINTPGSATYDACIFDNNRLKGDISEGDLIIAERLKTPEEIIGSEDEYETLIETRGEGGFITVAPSSGGVLESGGLDKLSTLSPDEREKWFELNRSLDEIDDEISEPAESHLPTTGDDIGDIYNSYHPIDIYNATASWDELLGDHGWGFHDESNGQQFWTEPGKDPSRGYDATVNFNGSNKLYVFSTSTLFKPKHPYTLFEAYMVLEHCGDYDAAVKALGKQTANPWEPLIPLDEPDPALFPVDALPEPIRAWVKAESEAAQVPVDLPAVVALGVVSAAVAGKARVLVREGYREPLNLYLASALAPANRKTQVFANGTRPIMTFELELSRSMRSQVIRAQNEIKILSERLKNAQKAAVDAEPQDRSKLLTEADDLAEELAKAERNAPEYPRLVVDNVTPEKLEDLLQQQKGRIAALSAEGGELFEIIGGRYSQNARPNLSVFLNGHAGDTIRVDRMKRESIHVEDPSLTICLAVQLEVIRGLTSNANSLLRGRGLLGRFLYSIPRSPLGRRESAPAPVPPVVSAAYAATVEQLLKLPIKNSEVRFSREATTAWIRFSTDLEPKLGEHGELGHIDDWAGKLAGAVARLAGVLHAVKWANQADPWTHPIEAETVEQAIQLGHYFTEHAKLAFGLMSVDVDIERAMRIWRWIKDTGLTEVGRKGIWQQFKSRTIRKATELDVLLNILIAHHYLRQQSAPKSELGKPGRKTSVYDVNPEALDL